MPGIQIGAGDTRHEGRRRKDSQEAVQRGVRQEGDSGLAPLSMLWVRALPGVTSSMNKTNHVLTSLFQHAAVCSCGNRWRFPSSYSGPFFLFFLLRKRTAWFIMAKFNKLVVGQKADWIFSAQHRLISGHALVHCFCSCSWKGALFSLSAW